MSDEKLEWWVPVAGTVIMVGMVFLIPAVIWLFVHYIKWLGDTWPI